MKRIIYAAALAALALPSAAHAGCLMIQGASADYRYEKPPGRGPMLVDRNGVRKALGSSTSVCFSGDTWIIVDGKLVPNFAATTTAPDDTTARDRALAEVIAVVQGMRR